MWQGFEPGDVFAGDYRVVSHLASGGMGSVYHVDQISTGKPRALKVMHPHYARDASLRARFEKEARVASLIESDHVVEVIGAGVDEKSGIPWLAMEFLRGATLDAIIREQGPLTLIAALEVAKQLHHALDQAHKKTLIHRDLKPENIFLAKPRRPDIPFNLKILDFGIAKWVQEAKDNMKNSEVIGTPFWMAPEQLDTEMAITPATDVWAVGLIMFWVLTGRMYWRRGNEAEPSVSAILKEMILGSMPPASVRLREIDPSRALPDGFDPWFERSVNRDMDKRYPTGGEALAAMVKLLADAEAKERAPAAQVEAAKVEPPRSAIMSGLIESVGPSVRPAGAAGGSASVRLREDRVWDALVIALEEEATDGSLPPDEVRLRWLEIAHVREHELNDPAGAALAYKRAAEIGGAPAEKPAPRAEPVPSLRSAFPSATARGGMFIKAPEPAPPASPMSSPMPAPAMFTKPSAAGPQPSADAPPQRPQGMFAPAAPAQPSPGMFTPAQPAQPSPGMFAPAAPAQAPPARPSQPAQPAPSPSSFRSARSAMFAPAEPSPPPTPASIPGSLRGAPQAPLSPAPQAPPAAAPIARSPFPRLERRIGTLPFNPVGGAAAPVAAPTPAAPGASPTPAGPAAPAAPAPAAAAPSAPPAAAPAPVASGAPPAGAPDVTIEQWRQMIAAAPRRPEGWIGCFEHYQRIGDVDAAWCVAHTASVVIASDLPDSMRAFHVERAPTAPQVVVAPMSDALLHLAWDPELDLDLARVFALLVPALSAVCEVKLADLGITQAQLINPAGPPDERSAATGHGVAALLTAAAALHVGGMPSLYYRIESPPGFTHTRALPRASIVGGAARRTWKLEAMRYAAAEHMTFYRPEFYARVLAPSGGELDDVFSSARAIVAGVPRGLMTPLAQRIAERLSASDVAALTDAVGKVREVNIARFRRDVDRTAVRVGFLFCRDFMATRDALRDVEPLAGAPTPVERLRAAVHFSVSDAYFKLRRQLGLALT